MNVPGGLRLSYGAATDVGLVREVNEDSYLAEPPVFVVADGMGGHDGGDIASRFVVEEFAGLVEAGYDPSGAKDAVLATFRSCRQRLSRYGTTHRGSDGGRWLGGTTTVVALLAEDQDGPRWLLVNLGDSRIYRYADGLHRVSTDHSVVQELVDSGRISEQEALVHPERHIVTRALGSPDPLEPDFFDVPIADAPRVLLCSDGVTDLVRDDEIAHLLAAHPDARDAADAIVGAALRSGGVDNATALVVDVVGWADHQHEKPGALP
jgi:serine/threonine protein phosphatase PrpC